MSAFLSAVLLWAMQVGAATFPATVEVDLIFPRNDTYAPSILFPIVFAFQNAALASSLDPSLDLLLWDSTFSHANDSTLNLKSTNFSNEPTFVYTYISTLNTTADGAPTSYMLSWELGARNCSHGGLPFIGGGFRSLGVTFTIANGAPNPDLVGATTNSALCTNASHFAFNLTGTLDVYPAQYDGRNSCAVLSDVQPLVDGDPCAVHVDSATASSISAALTATACADAVSPLVSCPSKQNAAAADTKAGFPAMLSGFVAALVAMQLL
ncbi:uncharacterized protein B0T23DRAFT_203133 [Neurospora hispaniola]|uniref:DUF7136 domain-containing protein n=1 Tax=Neurospora hispaniola TaxID=588809 RepID=A0AAJ0MPQ1_9PEZI|nr:hypothetical protein B0T23DRAFT_203133 [Neurospora hispaniola]